MLIHACMRVAMEIKMDDVADFDEEQVERAMAAMRLLPAWFAERMMTDVWSFGLLLETGHTLCIERIVAVTQGADGTVWIDVEMLTRPPLTGPPFGAVHKPLTAPTPRTRASVQASKIVAAFELADT